MRRGITLWFAALMMAVVGGSALRADNESPATPTAETSPAQEAGQDESIASAQLGLAMRYQRFENTMLQVAEYLRKTDPERADLLVRAIGKSKETRLPDQFEQLVNLLKQEQLGDAVQEQEHVVVLMEGLLELLQSEDRKDEIEKEKQRIKDLIKDVDRLIDRQTDVRSHTERKENPQGLEQAQKKLAGDAQRLVKKIDGQDRAKSAAEAAQGKAGSQSPKPPAEKDADSEDQPPSAERPKNPDEPANQPKEEKQPGEQQNSDKKPSSDGGQNSSDKQQQPGKPSPGKSSPPMPPQPGQPSPSPKQEQDGADSEQQPSGQQDSPAKPKTPGRDEIERAKQDMERAIEELNKKNHGRASDEQDKALSELVKAKDRLEDILRQLREEEREMLLAALEARFRDMLARQLAVYNSTVGLNALAEGQRTDRHRNQSVALARAEEAISLMAAKALTLLKEEGSSIAFPEAVEEMRDDMLTVVQRLERFDVAELTQGIERDIMESLEELIQALQKEMEKSKNKDKDKAPPSESGEPPDPALVDQLAELKTLRALQFRVNRRTKVLGREVEGEQAVDPDLVKQLHNLAKRQDKIQRATYDLSTGRNR